MSSKRFFHWKSSIFRSMADAFWLAKIEEATMSANIIDETVFPFEKLGLRFV